nr:hypothetical protein [Tanacetum cinerariifolium]
MRAVIDVRCVFTLEALDAFCNTFHIPEEVHPVLPNQDDTMHERPAGKIRDPALVAANFNAKDYATLVAHPSSFRKFPKAFLCLDEPRLLETTVGRTVPLLPVAPDRAETSMSTTPEHEDEDHTDSVAEPNLRPIGVLIAARQMCLSVELRMHAEYNVKERRRLKFIEAEAAEAIRLRAQTSNLEAVEKSFWDEVNALKGRNVILEKERDALDVKVTDLEASVVGKERDLTDLNAQLTYVKSQNDSIPDKVHELEVSFAELQEKILVYDNCMEQLEKFQDDWMKVVDDKLAKLDSDLAKMACHLAAISCAIEKGMQSGLAVDINHGREGRSLADVATYNPDVEANFNTALQELREVDFPLLAKLKSYKDASTKDIMNVHRLEGALADVHGMKELQPDVEQLKVPIHRSEDQEESTSGVVPSASVTTTTLSTTFASASSIPPISTNDYEIVGVDGQEGAGTDGRAVIDGNFSSFPNVDDVELHIP